MNDLFEKLDEAYVDYNGGLEEYEDSADYIAVNIKAVVIA